MCWVASQKREEMREQERKTERGKEKERTTHMYVCRRHFTSPSFSLFDFGREEGNARHLVDSCWVYLDVHPAYTDLFQAQYCISAPLSHSLFLTLSPFLSISWWSVLILPRLLLTPRTIRIAYIFISFFTNMPYTLLYVQKPSRARFFHYFLYLPCSSVLSLNRQLLFSFFAILTILVCRCMITALSFNNFHLRNVLYK